MLPVFRLSTFYEHDSLYNNERDNSQQLSYRWEREGDGDNKGKRV